MIRDLMDVEEDPLSPALRDIERERGGPELHKTHDGYAFFVWYVGVEAKRWRSKNGLYD